MSISRRNVLATGAAAITTAAVSAPLALKSASAKAALAGDPLLAMERQWLAQRDYIHSFPHESDAEIDPLYDRQCALEKKIMTTPARSVAGIAVKLRLATYYTYPGPLDREGCDWDVRFTFHALNDAERLSGEAQS